MAYKIRVTLDIDWVGDGTYQGFMGVNQSNNPGYGATLLAGGAGLAQTLELMVAEAVPGGDSPSQANFNTALSQAATDLGTLMGTAGAAFGVTATPYNTVALWSTGGV